MGKTTFQEFIIPKRTLVLKNKNGKKTRSHMLGHYNLSMHNMLYIEFATDKEPDGSKNFINRLSNNDPMACLKGIYLLIEDKTDFPLFEDFTKMFDKFNAPLHEMQILLTEVFNDSIPNYRKKKLASLALKTILVMMCAGILYLI
jgi:hypothetical protein